MEQQEVKQYIKKLKKDLSNVRGLTFLNSIYWHNPVLQQALTKEKQDIKAAISDCKSLLPRPWWKVW